jgi:O-antigen ligase
MALAILGLLQRVGSLRFPAPLLWFAVYVAWSAAGALGSEFRDVAIENAIHRGKVLIIAMAAYNALRSRPQLRLFLVLFVASFTLVPARAALVGYFRGYSLFGRAIGPFIYSNPNYLAAIAILAFGIGLSLVATERKYSLIWLCCVATVPLLVLLILLTQSRGAFIALVIFAVPFVIGVVRRRPKAVIGFAALGVLALAATPATVWDRLSGIKKLGNVETVADADKEGSAKERYGLLMNGLEITRAHPLFGVGLGGFSYANAEIDPAMGRRDAHNTYITIVSETGLPGLAFFFLMLGTTFVPAWRSYRRAQPIFPEQAEQLRILMLGLMAFLIAGLFGTYSTLPFFFLYVALVWCVADSLARDVRVVTSQAAMAPANQLPATVA